MPYNFLVWQCLESGTTAIREKHKSAKFQRMEGECILAFRLDSDHFRKQFGLDGKRVCDGLFFFWRPGAGPFVLFVELKGADFGAAVEQLALTLTALRRRAKGFPAKFVAVVVTDRTVPTDIDKVRQQFQKEHGVPLYVSKDGEMRRFIE